MGSCLRDPVSSAAWLYKKLHYATEVHLAPCRFAVPRLVPRSIESTLETMVEHVGTGEMGIDDLFPAVIECFSVIILGYIAGKSGLISSADTKGLNTFIGTFALPALIFLSISQLNLNSVNWYFLLAIFLARTSVFVAVVVVSLLVRHRLDKAAIFGIFSTQSNDFALGYPIIVALYGKIHPEYASYLYLVAPVNLIFLNPIAFTLMELCRQREIHYQELQDSTGPRRSGTCGLVLKRVLSGVCLNPVVLMTGLGICANLIFSHCLPKTLAGTLGMLGSAFSSSALFSLGLTMVGSAASLKGAGLVVPGILIAMKTLVLPLISRELVTLLNAGSTANETLSLSNFGFLIGTFPTAPGVFVFAVQFQVAVEMIASAMVACTFVSAPLMFISAKMTTLSHLSPGDYIPDLDSFLFNMSILGVTASLFVLVIFLLSGKYRKVPHFFTLCLVASQAMGCAGAILWSIFGVHNSSSWKLYLQFSCLSFGVLSARVWTAILATSLVFLRCRSLCFVLKLRPFMVLIGWGVPAALTTLLLITVRHEMIDEKSDPNFQYGETQALVTAMVLVICWMVTVGCLVMQQRYERAYAQLPEPEQDQQLPRPAVSNGVTPHVTAPRTVHAPSRPRCASLNCGTCPSAAEPTTTVDTTANEAPLTQRQRASACLSEIEDLVDDAEDDDDERSLFSYSGDLCSPKKHNCDSAQRRHCTILLERYRSMNQLTEPEEIGLVRDRDDEYQMLRHIILLLFLSASMFVGIALCLWTLIMEDVSGIYIELLFLDAALNFGQGIFTFLLFGLDTKMILMPLMKWWRRLVYGQGSIQLPKWEELPQETRQVCETFLTYHFDKCVGDIVRDRRWRMEAYTEVFCGHELVDWLLLVGLARDRTEAVKYGRHLLSGRVIRHVKQLHHFHDQPFFYTFSPLPAPPQE